MRAAAQTLTSAWICTVCLSNEQKFGWNVDRINPQGSSWNDAFIFRLSAHCHHSASVENECRRVNCSLWNNTFTICHKLVADFLNAHTHMYTQQRTYKETHHTDVESIKQVKGQGGDEVDKEPGGDVVNADGPGVVYYLTRRAHKGSSKVQHNVCRGRQWKHKQHKVCQCDGTGDMYRAVDYVIESINLLIILKLSLYTVCIHQSLFRIVREIRRN